MIGRIYAIALNTFREAIRNRVLYGIVGVVAAFNLFAIVLGEWSVSEEARVARDMGLGGISLFGSITAIVLGVSLLYAEIQKKTVHIILAKPIGRSEFLVGKYLGMVCTLTLLVGLFTLALAGMLALQQVRFDAAVGKAVALGYLEVLVVAAVAVFFSSFSTPFLSGIFAFALFFLGRVSPEIRYAAYRTKAAWIKTTARVALRIVPDLSVFGISGGQVDGQHVSVHSTFVTWGYVGNAALYAFALIAILLCLAALSFRRRDFV